MEPVTVTRYRAFDGRLFDTEIECKAHEEANSDALLIGLTAEQVRAAVAREPGSEAISNALERAGTQIARARREAGELRRGRRAEKASDPAPAPEQEPEDETEPEAA